MNKGETMNKSIELLKQKLSILKSTNAINESTLKLEIRDQLSKVFKKDKSIKAIIALQDAKPDSYQYSEFGDVESYHRIENFDEVKTKFADYLEYLVEYIQDMTYGTVDLKYNALTINNGPNEIIINDDGDVYQSGKLIISVDDYRSVDSTYADTTYSDIGLRNELIEKHMEKTGFFPGVFESDRYGNLTFVSTVKTEKSAV